MKTNIRTAHFAIVTKEGLLKPSIMISLQEK